MRCGSWPGGAVPIALTPLGERELKGLPDPIALFAVGWAPITAERGFRFRIGWRPESSAASFGFFGRERERVLLVDAVKSAAAGSGRSRSCRVSRGSARHRCVARSRSRRYELDVCVLYGRCDEDLGVVVSAVRRGVVASGDPCRRDVLAEHVACARRRARRAWCRRWRRACPDLPAVQSADPDTERARSVQCGGGAARGGVGVRRVVVGGRMISTGPTGRPCSCCATSRGRTSCRR